MAYQKLQQTRAIQVIPADGVVVPNPGGEVASGQNTTLLQDHLVDSNATCTGKVNVGATVYNINAANAATVTAVSENSLRLSADIFTGATGKQYIVYNIDSIGPVLYTGSGGQLDVYTAGNDFVSIKNVQPGVVLPLMVKTVEATGTTATGIIALW